jgi:ABC-type branched-subunit amino acid transport system ATPase component
VVAEPSVQVVDHRRVSAARQRLHRQGEPAGPGRSRSAFCPCAVRAGGGCVRPRAEDPTDADAVAAAIAATDIDTLVGTVAWGGEGLPSFAAKNVCKTPLVGGQWRLKNGWRLRPRHRREQDRARRFPSAARWKHASRLQRPDPETGRSDDPDSSTTFRSVSARLKVADGDELFRAARRGARHHRPERRGQVDAVQPDQRHIAVGRRASTSLGRDVTRASRRWRAACRASGAPSRSRSPSRLTCSRTCWSPPLSAAADARRRCYEGCAQRSSTIAELLDKANVPAGSLTLLERKRLELARALATDPKLLLLDEIAGGLTEGECKALVATIRASTRRASTIVWIEHVLHALTSVVERLLVLNFGRVIAEGVRRRGHGLAEVQRNLHGARGHDRAGDPRALTANLRPFPGAVRRRHHGRWPARRGDHRRQRRGQVHADARDHRACCRSRRGHGPPRGEPIGALRLGPTWS